MKKIMILAAGIAAFSSPAMAQISFAPEVGINFANQHGKYTYAGVEHKTEGGMKLGAKAGLNVNIPVGERIVIQPGIFYSTKGYKDSKDQPTFPVVVANTTIRNNRTVHYADIPVNIQYMFNDPSEGRFFIGVGGYAGIAFSGHDKIATNVNNTTSTEMTHDLKFGNDAPSNDMRRFDFGGQVNVGYLLRSGLFFRGMYQAGISNLIPQGNRTTGDASLRNTNITVSLGYMLGDHPKSKGPRMKGSTPM